MLSLSLPVAPTSNNAFANRKTHRPGRRNYGRVKSKAYRNWVAQADKHYTLQGLGRVQPVRGRYSCEIVFPDSIRGDLDGRLKLILDWLVSRNLVEGDSPTHLREVHTKFKDETGDLVWITIKPVEP